MPSVSPCSLNQPKPEVVQQAPGGGRRFLALDAPRRVLVATARDPAVYEYQGAMRQATNQWASGERSGAVTCRCGWPASPGSQPPPAAGWAARLSPPAPHPAGCLPPVLQCPSTPALPP